jgi:hypothetical protein
LSTAGQRAGIVALAIFGQQISDHSRYPAFFNHTIKSQKNNISNDASVTGTPTAACRENVIFIPQFPACSTTIRFAMLPNKNKLPAKVLDTASVYHWLCSRGSRKFMYYRVMIPDFFIFPTPTLRRCGWLSPASA